VGHAEQAEAELLLVSSPATYALTPSGRAREAPVVSMAAWLAADACRPAQLDVTSSATAHRSASRLGE
jgi:hypothetical protein